MTERLQGNKIIDFVSFFLCSFSFIYSYVLIKRINRKDESEKRWKNLKASGKPFSNICTDSSQNKADVYCTSMWGETVVEKLVYTPLAAIASMQLIVLIFDAHASMYIYKAETLDKKVDIRIAHWTGN